MPAGLQQTMTKEELVDLVEYLVSLHASTYIFEAPQLPPPPPVTNTTSTPAPAAATNSSK